MAKPTIASLTAELEAAQKELKGLKERESSPTISEDEYKLVKTEMEASIKALEELEQKYLNLSEEHEALTLEYNSSPDLEKKVQDAVKKLSDKPKALLFKKMSLALGEVKRIPKNGWNDFFKYKYSQEGDILDGIRPILADVGLMVWTTIAEEQRKAVTTYYKGKENGQKTITWVKIEFMVGCADTGETIVSHYSGEGEDEGDKGLYKAYTGATKYFLTKNFLISSGDILQDDAPTDPEADTQRAYDKQNSRQNPYNSPKQRQKQEHNQQARKEYESEQKAADALKNEAKELWVTLAGNEEGFEGFYKKQTSKGVSHMQVLDFLNSKIAEKQAEEKQQQQTEQTPPPEAPPEIDPQNHEYAPPLEPKNNANKNPDDMTPEEYLVYVEDNLPFPLTPTEREQILNDARNGNRNHRK